MIITDHYIGIRCLSLRKVSKAA